MNISVNDSNNISLGTWLQSGSPVIAEIMANAGFEWVAADLEHAPIDWGMFSHFVRAVSRYGAKPYARVAENSVMAIRKALDCGALGIIVPLVNNAQDAKKAVSAAKYPPEGIRGFAFCQANEWGDQFDQYVALANDEVRLLVMVESKEAVEHIDEILSVKGVDGVFIGPYDLSGSYGIIGQTSHPSIVQAKEKVVSACKKHGKTAGQHIVLPTKENIKEAIEMGYSFMALGMDTVFISNSARNILSSVEGE